MKIILSALINSLLVLFALCMTSLSFADSIKAKWSTAGPLSGEYKHCIAIDEPSESQASSWDDNYLCFNKPNHGFNYSYDGRIPGLTCRSMDIKGGIWGDNYICGVDDGFNFFPRKLPGGYKCIRITEPADDNPRANGSDGYSNHFCLRK